MKNLELNLGKPCNNRCVFCATGEQSRGDKGWMRLDEVDATLRRGRSEGAESVGLVGGEPTLYGELPAVVRLGDEDVWVVTPRSSFWLLESVISANRFGPRCDGCSRRGVCWGLREDYLARYGDDEVVPYGEPEP